MSTQVPDPTTLVRRPKRADALRNYEKLVAAAREAFREADRSASLEDIAKRAGVGIGTLYRNFPTRAELVEAVYVEEVERVSRRAVELEDDPDPWLALTTWLHGFVDLIATKQMLADELFALGSGDAPVFEGCRASLHAAGEVLLRRAQDAGVVRADLTAPDVVRMVAGIAKIPAASPEEVRHILDVALDGLRYRA